MLYSTVGNYNQMYNMPEFNRINKEDTMSQGTKGSTKLMIAVWAIVMLFIGFKAFNSSNDDSASKDFQVDSATIERIKQIGEVRIDSNIAVSSTDISNQSERTGEQVYSKCQSCHDSGIMDAPKFGSLEDWAPRIEHGIDNLLMVAITGKGGMPPKGTCMDCSDNELKSAIQYMIDNAK
jgi:cytochrome c5